MKPSKDPPEAAPKEIIFTVNQDPTGTFSAIWRSAQYAPINVAAEEISSLYNKVKKAIKDRWKKSHIPRSVLLHFVREGQYIPVRCSEEPPYPSDNEFSDLSFSYCEAANKLSEATENGDFGYYPIYPILFLYLRSIELALKAALARARAGASGKIEEDRTHSLRELLGKIDEYPDLRSLIPPQERMFLEIWSDAYAPKWLEYDVSLSFESPRGPRPLPDCQKVQAVAKSVGEKLHDYLESTDFPKPELKPDR